MNSSLQSLGDKLFSYGGRVISHYYSLTWPPEIIQNILNNGQLFNKAILYRIEPNDCFENCIKYRKEFGGQIMGGFALAEDMWQEHFWIKTENGLVETTELRLLYYGIPVL